MPTYAQAGKAIWEEIIEVPEDLDCNVFHGSTRTRRKRRRS